MKNEHLAAGALSPDGYIVSQEQTKNLRYGRLASSVNGCGWIAAYNLFRLMGLDADPLAIKDELAASSPFGAAAGTGPNRLCRYVQQRGLVLHTAAGRAGALRLARRAKGGILFYVHRYEPHFVAFAALEDGRFRFFNAEDGNAAHLLTMDAFFRQYVKLPVLKIMVTI